MSVNFYKEIALDEIKPSPYQQRKYFDVYSLNALTESVKKYGILVPVAVRNVNGRYYELVYGERRLRAAKAAGLEKVPAICIDADERESSIFAFSENIQRKNIGYIEEAEGYKALMTDFGFSIEEISSKMGISCSVINNRIKMLELPKEAIKLISENKLSEDYIKAVLKIPDDELRLTAVKDIIREAMTVKKAEDYVDKILFCMRFGSHSQKVKANISDMKIFTNSIRQTVDMARNAGIPANYDIIEKENSIEISIKIVCPPKIEAVENCG